jgi:hypothetical protein
MSSASRGTSQQRSTGAQPPPGAKARPAEPICPYSFVPISQSLTPDLSARTLRALESQGLQPTERKVTVPDFGSTRFTAKTAFEKRKPGVDYCAVRVLQNGVSSLAESNTQLSDTQRNERVRQGLIVGDLVADPRFATRDMWQTGEITEFDRARMFWRMAWLAENKEDKLVGLSRIQVADLRSMEDLQLMWQEVDAKIPFLGSGRTGATANSGSLRSPSNTFQSQGAGQRPSSSNDAGDSDYEPSKPGFPWVAVVMSVVLTAGAMWAVPKYALPSDAKTTEPDSVPAEKPDLRLPTLEECQGFIPAQTKCDEPPLIHLASGKEVKGQVLGADQMYGVLQDLVRRSKVGLRFESETDTSFDIENFRVGKKDNPPDWTSTDVFIFKIKSDNCKAGPPPEGSEQTPRLQAGFDLRPILKDVCAYGPKSLLDQLKIPE